MQQMPGHQSVPLDPSQFVSDASSQLRGSERSRGGGGASSPGGAGGAGGAGGGPVRNTSYSSSINSDTQYFYLIN